MTQWVNHLPSKNESLNSDPQSPDTVAYVYNACTLVGSVAVGTKESRDLMGQLAWCAGDHQETLSPTTWKVRAHPRLSSYLHMHACHMLLHTLAHTCT